MTASLLERMIAAHGGFASWRRVEAIAIELRASGLAFAMHGNSGVYSPEVRIAAHRPDVSFVDFGRRGETGRFTPERVWAETPTGDVRVARDNPRAAFRRSLRRAFRWDQLDLLYFCGYAIWNYMTAPFLFASPSIAARQLAPNRLALTFQPVVPTHSSHQTVYTDAGGLVARLDYTADVIGPYARAANQVLENREVDGLTFAVARHVAPRGPGGRALPGPLLVDIRIGEVDVRKTTELKP